MLVALFQKKQQPRKHSNNYRGVAVYKYKSKYIAKYIRNILLSRKQTLQKVVRVN